MSNLKEELRRLVESGAESIAFSDTFMGDEGCRTLCEQLKDNRNVRSLDLRGCNIRSDGSVALANLVSRCEGCIPKVFVLVQNRKQYRTDPHLNPKYTLQNRQQHRTEAGIAIKGSSTWPGGCIREPPLPFVAKAPPLILEIVKDKLPDLWGSWLLQNDFENTLSEISSIHSPPPLFAFLAATRR